MRYNGTTNAPSAVEEVSQSRRAISAGKLRHQPAVSAFQSARRASSAEPSRQDIYDSAESGSFSSDSTKTTPSKKARDLRKQLDEALQASKEIRLSQEKLGTELRTFKSRFYRRNVELEDHAARTINSSEASSTNYNSSRN